MNKEITQEKEKAQRLTRDPKRIMQSALDMNFDDRFVLLEALKASIDQDKNKAVADAQEVLKKMGEIKL